MAGLENLQYIVLCGQVAHLERNKAGKISDKQMVDGW